MPFMRNISLEWHCNCFASPGCTVSIVVMEVRKLLCFYSNQFRDLTDVCSSEEAGRDRLLVVANIIWVGGSAAEMVAQLVLEAWEPPSRRGRLNNSIHPSFDLPSATVTKSQFETKS